eukprot:CAMPEP_0117457488 /NCGR_PEP_ID=MMETSP0784-20121206/431_1 /TAXON_ID=39447 /ORGANISM="" /LENGTH=43 /DNA_ID= /DNA_START= /DNA_END= /DNA_ORIENTATION=
MYSLLQGSLNAPVSVRVVGASGGPRFAVEQRSGWRYCVDAHLK